MWMLSLQDLMEVVFSTSWNRCDFFNGCKCHHCYFLSRPFAGDGTWFKETGSQENDLRSLSIATCFQWFYLHALKSKESLRFGKAHRCTYDLEHWGRLCLFKLNKRLQSEHVALLMICRLLFYMWHCHVHLPGKRKCIGNNWCRDYGHLCLLKSHPHCNNVIFLSFSFFGHVPWHGEVKTKCFFFFSTLFLSYHGVLL